MDYEKKYKEALKAAISAHKDEDRHLKATLERIFPELKEGEDERIRKFLIKWIQDNYYHGTTEIPAKTLIAWLEKQGGEKSSIEMITPEESLGIDSETYNKIVDECIYGEQKPACSDDKKLTDVNHEYYSELLENNNSKDINDYAYQVAYCMSHDWIEETATWDDVQKACKLGAKWQEKHGSSKDWNEEDETNSYHLKTLLENLTKDIKHEFRVISDNDRDKYTAWLKSLKGRTQPKQEWSKEDEAMLDTMEGWLDTLCEYLKDSSSEYIPDVESCINWLKTLKQKIGG